MNLHYSQTLCFSMKFSDSFTTLWIYTTLKLVWKELKQMYCFTTLWIYTTLKRAAKVSRYIRVLLPYEFTLLSNRTGCLPVPAEFYYLMNLHYSQTCTVCSLRFLCFTTLWIYTTLKLGCSLSCGGICFTTLWIYTTLKLTSLYLL